MKFSHDLLSASVNLCPMTHTHHKAEFLARNMSYKFLLYIYIYIYIYIRPISCNKPVKYNSIFHCVKYKKDRILFGRFIS